MKLASFDLEIAKAVEGDDWQTQRLGISCAAVMLPEMNVSGAAGLVRNLAGLLEGPDLDLRYFYEISMNQSSVMQPQMSVSGAAGVVCHLAGLAADGFTIVTVNGAGFDFAVLAEESGMVAECADLMLNHHCDLMMMSVCRLGWRVGLERLAHGAGVQGKLHNVSLKDGRIIDNMNGAMAPRLWAEGEHEAVLAYLKDDVRATLQTAERAVELGSLGWYSSNGRWWQVPLVDGRLPTVAECLLWPRPDTSWMSDPPDPDEAVAWAR